MYKGILAGLFWALETIVLSFALSMSPLISSQRALFLAPFVSTFIHDMFSALWATIYNAIKGNSKHVLQALKSPNGKYVVLAAIIGGPIGMSGYVLTINYLGASIGAVASAIFPAIGTLLACIFLKEKMLWARWIFLIMTMLGVYGLSYSPTLHITNFFLGICGAFMCAFGWGIEAVILAKSMQDDNVKDEYALQIRQTTSALVYGLIILPFIGGLPFTISLFKISSMLIPTIACAGLFATISYLFYYKAIASIGASKAMALDISYAGWAVIFSIILFKDYTLLNPMTIVCTFVVIVCGVLSATDFKQ